MTVVVVATAAAAAAAVNSFTSNIRYGLTHHASDA